MIEYTDDVLFSLKYFPYYSMENLGESTNGFKLCIFGIAAVIVGVVTFRYFFGKKDEHGIDRYIDPIFVNEQKMKCDRYPRTNGSIYGSTSNIFSGYPYYDKAY